MECLGVPPVAVSVPEAPHLLGGKSHLLTHNEISVTEYTFLDHRPEESTFFYPPEGYK